MDTDALLPRRALHALPETDYPAADHIQPGRRQRQPERHHQRQDRPPHSRLLLRHLLDERRLRNIPRHRHSAGQRSNGLCDQARSNRNGEHND